MLGIFVTAILNWFASHYVIYSHIVEELDDVDRAGFSFLAYLQLMSESFAFSSRSGESGEPMGKLGYLFTLLEMGGLGVGTLIPVIVLRQKPCCHRCARYLKKAELRSFGSALSHADLKKQDKEARTEKLTSAIEEVVGLAHQVAQEVGTADFETTARRIREIPESTDKKALAHVDFRLQKCPLCDGHHVQIDRRNAPLNGQPNQETLAVMDKT